MISAELRAPVQERLNPIRPLSSDPRGGLAAIGVRLAIRPIHPRCGRIIALGLGSGIRLGPVVVMPDAGAERKYQEHRADYVLHDLVPPTILIGMYLEGNREWAQRFVERPRERRRCADQPMLVPSGIGRNAGKGALLDKETNHLEE